MIIISSVNNYSPDQLRCFVESLNDVGYGGTKIMLVHHDYENTIEYLKNNGWVVVRNKLYMLQHIQRYKESSEILKNYPNQKVLFLDCRDVFFNKNPEDWNLDKPLYVGADGFFPLSEHRWGREHILKSYPRIYNEIKNLNHLNCGVIFGDLTVMVDFLFDVFETALTSNQRIGIGPMDFSPDDQMGVNVLCYTKYKDVVTIQSRYDNYFINMAETEWDREIEYYLYHQYDRVADFNLNKKYLIFI